jgi:hypothetical protein
MVQVANIVVLVTHITVQAANIVVLVTRTVVQASQHNVANHKTTDRGTWTWDLGRGAEVRDTRDGWTEPGLESRMVNPGGASDTGSFVRQNFVASWRQTPNYGQLPDAADKSVESDSFCWDP